MSKIFFLFYGFGSFCHNHKLTYISKLIEIVQFLLFNSYVPHSSSIGSGTKFAYGCIGVVIHKRAVIGKNCTIGQGITIGGRSKSIGVPWLGDNVYIGAGARILGDLKVGDNVIIAPNSVVISDVPCNCIVGGIPAKILRNNIDPLDYI
ncbi:serine O-acetyltransferase [Vibrio alginolyticus]|uniref:serine O-acetyltransferase n=1 Tax=Vibrio diabolicus TaxID=50719 RepID=UPI002940D615|nr:serine acetyltransferase [Vibrio diabolicus]EHV9685138.1 serine acetyltransferase [Vibrio parahaemolyticus]MDV5085855.1 serine acetyltransferase [Vibrio diabolicus]